MKKVTALLLALSMVFTMAACGSKSEPAPSAPAASGNAPAASAPAAEKTYDKPEFKLQIGHSDPTTNLAHVSLENYAAWVKEQTKGRVEITIYAAEQLGSNAEMGEMIEMGSLYGMLCPQGQVATYAEKVNAVGLPFLFPSYEAAWAVLDTETDLGKELIADLENRNMIGLAYWENGLRQTTNSVRPINQPSDLNGLKIRTPEDALTLATFNALGASPSPLAFAELYLALQQGTFDGQENPISNIHSSNFADVQKYLALTNHKYECKVMIVSKTMFEKLPAEVQDVLREGSLMFADEHRQAITGAADQMLQELKDKGMEVTTPDTSVFQAATEVVYTDFYAQYDWAKDLVAKMQAKIAEVA